MCEQVKDSGQGLTPCVTLVATGSAWRKGRRWYTRLPSIKTTGPGKWRPMRIAQMLQMQGLHGGAINSPNLTGFDALRILAYWWRTRGRFWKGWHQALAKLQSTGLRPTKEALDGVFTEEQSAIVWAAALQAAKDMERIPSARGLTPRAFEQLQTEKDAKIMFRRFLVKDLDSKIPPPLKQLLKAERKFPPKLPKLPEEIEKILPRPKIPKRPGLGGVGWLLLAAVILWGRDD